MIVHVLDVLTGLVTVIGASGLLYLLSIGNYLALPDEYKPWLLALVVLCSLVLAAGMRLMAVGVWG